MCGLFGIVNLDKRPIDAGESLRLLDILEHRGPDGFGHYHNGHVFIGHRRLSIIDVEGGMQPIYNEKGDMLVIANGEIYNHEELRAELKAKGHSFKTRSDCEVLVHLFEEEGERCLERLNGMFAFAIYDIKRDSLFLARDRIGIKPLYYYRNGKQFIFSSEMKAIIKSGLIPLEVDDRVFYQYLTLHFSIPPDTLIRGLKSLKQGHYLLMNGGPAEQVQYWDIHSNVGTDLLSYDDAFKTVESLLRESVEMRLMSDVPLGLFLSGGIDSSLIAVLMHQIVGSGVKTFSIGFSDKEYSELPFAKRISEKISSDHTEIMMTPQEILDNIETVIWYRETPISEIADIPVFLLSRAAAKQVKVVLTGEGGDEVFAGYHKYLFEGWAQGAGILRNSAVRALMKSRLARGALPQRMSTAYDHFSEPDRFRRYYRWFSYFLSEELDSLVRGDKRALLTGEDTYEGIIGDRQFRTNLDEMQYLDIKVWLPENLLLRGDRMSMASSLEARVPFLDHRLVELSYRLPKNLKVRGMQCKYIIKKIAEKHLDQDMIYRKKVGFTVPLGDWMRNELKDFMIDHLTRNNSFCLDFLDRESLIGMMNDHVEGRRDSHRKLWILLNFELWRDRFLTNGDRIPCGTCG